MHLNMCCPNTSHARENTKCNLTCVNQHQPMSAAHKSEDTKCISTGVEHTRPMPAGTQKNISTCVGQTHPMAARAQNESKHVLTEPIPCQ